MSDAENLYRLACDGRVSSNGNWPRHESVDMSRAVLRDIFIPNEECYAICDKRSGGVVGCIGLVPRGYENYKCYEGVREVGYWVGYDFWGNGVMTECLGVMSGYWSGLAGVGDLLLTTSVKNVRSQRVAEKCGFRRVGEYHLDGEDYLVYIAHKKCSCRVCA